MYKEIPRKKLREKLIARSKNRAKESREKYKFLALKNSATPRELNLRGFRDAASPRNPIGSYATPVLYIAV